MGDPPRALGRYVPHVEGRGHELVGVDGALRRQSGTLAFRAALGPVEAPFARDDDALGDVAYHRVRGVAKRSPRAVSGRAFALAPDHLAAQQQFQVVLQDMDDVGREASVGLATEVRDVHSDAPTRFQLAGALGEDLPQHVEILEIRRRNTFALQLLLVLLAGEVRR